MKDILSTETGYSKGEYAVAEFLQYVHSAGTQREFDFLIIAEKLNYVVMLLNRIKTKKDLSPTDLNDLKILIPALYRNNLEHLVINFIDAKKLKLVESFK